MLTDASFPEIGRDFGGKDHTTHVLSYKGLTDRQVAIVFIALGMVSTLLAIMVAKYIPHDSLILVLICAYWVMLLIVFFSFSKNKE